MHRQLESALEKENELWLNLMWSLTKCASFRFHQVLPKCDTELHWADFSHGVSWQSGYRWRLFKSHDPKHVPLIVFCFKCHSCEFGSCFHVRSRNVWSQKWTSGTASFHMWFILNGLTLLICKNQTRLVNTWHILSRIFEENFFIHCTVLATHIFI